MAALQVKDKTASGSPLAEINMIPLIDVILVLLVIFIVTTPLLTHAVRIDLPRVSSQPITQKPELIALAIDAEGATFWNGEAVDRSEMRTRLDRASKQEPQPELHLHVHHTTEYRVVAEVLAAASKAGMTRIGFVSDPREQDAAPAK